MGYYRYKKVEGKSRPWTLQEEERLKSLALADMPLQRIAEELDRTPMAVILHMRQLSGLERDEAAGQPSDDYFDQSLTLQEVYPERMHPWSAMDSQRLSDEFYNGASVYQLAKMFHRSVLAIIQHIRKLNPTLADQQKLFDRAKLLLGKKKVNKGMS